MSMSLTSRLSPTTTFNFSPTSFSWLSPPSGAALSSSIVDHYQSKSGHSLQSQGRGTNLEGLLKENRSQNKRKVTLLIKLPKNVIHSFILKNIMLIKILFYDIVDSKWYCNRLYNKSCRLPGSQRLRGRKYYLIDQYNRQLFRVQTKFKDYYLLLQLLLWISLLWK